MNPQLRRVLRAENPWLRGEDLAAWLRRFLPARYIPRRLKLVAGRRAELVVGPRQAGKSTLVWKTLAEAGEPVLYLNCDEPSIRGWLASPAAFLADLAEVGPAVRALFLDEIQRLPQAGLFLKELVDHRTGLKIYAAGSSPCDLGAARPLASRVRRHLLLPLSLAELEETLPDDPAGHAAARAQLVERTLVFGGYPAVVTADDPRRALADLAATLVPRDPSDRAVQHHGDALPQVLEIAASRVGQWANFSQWARASGLPSTLLGSACRLLESHHLIRRVEAFVGGKRNEFTGARRINFLDNGLRNLFSGGFADAAGRPDRGELLENLAFTELAKTAHPLLDGLTAWHTKSGAELDAVIEHQGRLLACEVAADDLPARLSRSGRSFLEAYWPEQLLIVNRTPWPEWTFGATRVRFLRMEDLAGGVVAFLAARRAPGS
jgi:uncharacterized protein